MANTDALVRELDARSQLPPPRLRRALREAHDVRRSAVAAACGVTTQAVAHWESGRSAPVGEHLLAYAEVLKILADADSHG